MKCKNCGAPNDSQTQFCYKCGSELKANMSLMDAFPEYNLRPTSVFKCSGRPKFQILNIIAILFIIAGIICAICYYNNAGRAFRALILLFTPVALIGSIFLLITWKRSITHSIKDKCDFLQTNNKGLRYIFIGKDKNLGIYDKNTHKITLPCEYQSLEWREYGKLLSAQKDGKSMTIDIYGNVIE